MSDDIHKKASKALALLSALACPPTPNAYAVAYRHVEEPQGPVAEAVEALIREGLPVTAEALDAIHREIIDHPRIRAAVGASQELDEHVAASLAAVARASDSTGGFIASLDAAGAALSGRASDAVDDLVGRLREQTASVVAEQRTAARALADTHARMADLQARYDIALQEARVDPLTRLANRRAFDEHLSREVARADRGGLALSVLMLDIDHFKSINDTLGHAAGDKVIKAVADIMQKCIRTGDIAGRIGGEEFAIVLPGTDASRAAVAAERIRRQVENFQIMHGPDRRSVRQVSISLGLALHHPGEAGKSLLERADALLYAAKRGGRNRVVSEEDVMTPEDPDAGEAPRGP